MDIENQFEEELRKIEAIELNRNTDNNVAYFMSMAIVFGVKDFNFSPEKFKELFEIAMIDHGKEMNIDDLGISKLFDN